VHGCWTIGVKLPEDVPTVGGALSSAGYHTALVGKAHFQPTASQPGSESLESFPTLRDRPGGGGVAGADEQPAGRDRIPRWSHSALTTDGSLEIFRGRTD